MQQPGAELVLVRVAVLLDEAVRRERLQQAVHRRPREAELIGELAHAEPPRTAPQRLQDARRAVDRLDRPAPSRMVSLAFGIVESASIVYDVGTTPNRTGASVVGIVVVSHSREIASGTVALAGQMAGPDVRIEGAGGTPDGGLGTDADRVRAAIDSRRRRATA